MSTTLEPADVEQLLARLDESAVHAAPPSPRRGVHVVYGGAHLFGADTVAKLGARASEALDAHAPDAATFRAAFALASMGDAEVTTLRDHVRARLRNRPVDDLRIDFEDGFGPRTDAEEDTTALAAARALVAAASGSAEGPMFGVRIKSLGPSTRARALRTLDLFVGALASSGAPLPRGFVVTLPKVEREREVEVLADALDLLESRLGLDRGAVAVELMVESPSAVFDARGALALPRLVAAARGRCVGLHFGAYDYCSSLGIAAADQSLAHPACVLARQLLRIAGTQAGVAVSDGATNVLPVPLHRGQDLDDAQRRENTQRVHDAWRLHFGHVRQALREGFSCGWDLHPAQLVARHAAVHVHVASTFASDAARLRGFVEAAGRATLKGTVFDDAASALGLLNAVSAAVECGAVTPGDVERATGLALEEIRGRSFAEIVEARRTPT